jgi:hypothetical protein
VCRRAAIARRFSCAALAAALLASGGSAFGASLQAGAGVADLPAAPGAPLGGYGGLRDRIATGTLDPPQARALLLASRELRVALVAVDIVIVTPAIRDRVLERTRALAIDTLLIAATHTHSGPGGYIPGRLAARVTAGRYDASMPDRIAEATALAVERAARDLRPARVGWAEGQLDLARNRHSGGEADETALPVVRVDRPDGEPVIALYSYGCHPVVLSPRNLEYSADYVGAARALLDERVGTAIFLPGPLGDQNPESGLGALWPDDRDEMRAQLREVGERVASAVSDTRARIETEGEVPLQTHETWIERPPVKLRRWSALWWFRPFTQRAVVGFLSERTVFQSIRLGDALLIGFPAEISSALGAAARDAVSEDFVPIPIAHANDWLGYGVSSEAYRRGGYEASLSFFGAEFGPWLVERATATSHRLEREPVRTR